MGGPLGGGRSGLCRWRAGRCMAPRLCQESGPLDSGRGDLHSRRRRARPPARNAPAPPAQLPSTHHQTAQPPTAPAPAVAPGKPQVFAVGPGPGLLNSAAALLTAYSMNAPVLALVGQIPEGDIGRDLGHLHELRDQAGIIARLVDHSARIRSPQTASRLVAQAMRAMGGGRRGPAALECAIDVWGKAGAVALQAPLA